MARRPDPKTNETVAFTALRRAYESGRILVYTDPRIHGRPGTPSHSLIDVYAPPLVLFGASITLLTAFGMLEWIIGMVITILFWSFVQPPIVRYRAKRRAKAIAFASIEGLKVSWAIGGLALVLKDWPERNCVAPTGDWRGFANDYLVDPIDHDSAKA
jgi:hypothetical protein